MTTGRALELSGLQPEPDRKGRVLGLAGSQPTINAAGRVLELSGSQPPQLDVSIVSTPTDITLVEPGVSVELVASASGGSVTGWTWSISDPSVTLTGTGDTRTLTIPAYPFIGVLIVTATATSGTADPGEASVEITTAPHLLWTSSGGNLVPIFPKLLTSS